jgi:hypothetical protein
MANINTYGVDTATAREFQRLAEIGDIRNHVTFNPSWLDGSTDVTDELNDACTARRADAVDSVWLAPLILPPGRYKISDTINAQRVPIIAPHGAVILAQAVGTGKPAISWSQSGEAFWSDLSEPCAKNLWIRGRDTVTNSVTYTAGANGIACGVPGGRWENCYIQNFDQAITFDDYAYIQRFFRVRASWNNIGFSWGLDNAVAGERIVFEEGNLSNNNEGFVINHNVAAGAGRSGSFYFSKTSIDYNITRHGRLIGPTTDTNDLLTGVIFDNCHFETSISVSGSSNARIENAVNLGLSNCHIYENEFGTYPAMIASPAPGRCSVVNNDWALEGTSAWCTGNGNWRASGNRQRYGGTVNITSTVTDAPA